MAAYPEVPLWWFVSLGVTSFAVGIVVIEVYDTQLPIWAYALCIALAILYAIPAGIVLAVSNQSIGLK